MNNLLLLISAITLLYRESQQVGHTNNAADLVRQVVEEVRMPEVSLGRDIRDLPTEVLMGLRETALYMANMPYNHQYELNEILQRLKMNTGPDEYTYNALEDGLRPELSENALKRTCLNLQKQLRNYFREKEITQVISQAFQKIKYGKTKISSMPDFVADVVNQLSVYQSDVTEADPAVVGEVDFGNSEQITAVFKTAQEADNDEWTMRTGFQGLNRALDGGFRRGESWVTPALQHNFKTGSSLTFFRQLAMYNVPKMIDPRKKPLMVRITFEDSLRENFTFLYQQMYINENRKAPDLAAVTDQDMAAYVMQRLTQTGYHIKMIEVNPSMWTYLDIQNKILQYESEGFEVHVCAIDYLPMIPTTGCTMTTIGSDIRDLYRRMRNFFKSRMTTMLTPHQLSMDAKKLIREGHGDLVKMVNGKGYYDGCGRLDQEVDGELYQHIEYVNGKAFLTFQRGKHRKTRQTPIADRYFVLPFHEIGDLLDDINGPDTTLKRPGGGPIGSTTETPYWMHDDPIAALVQ